MCMQIKWVLYHIHKKTFQFQVIKTTPNSVSMLRDRRKTVVRYIIHAIV